MYMLYKLQGPNDICKIDHEHHLTSPRDQTW